MNTHSQERAGSTTRTPLGRFLREPVVHFTLLGGLAFAVQAVQGDSERAPIVVTPAVEQSQQSRLAETLARPPTSEDLSAAIDEWIEREALYREGLKQGLDRDDPLIRRQVIENLIELHDLQQVPYEPTDEEIEAHVDKHGASYSLPIRYDLELFRFEGAAGAEQAQQLSERFRSHRRTTTNDKPERILARPPGFLKENYGAAFVAAVASAQPMEWFSLESKRGWAVVRVLRVRGGPIPKDQQRRRAGVELRRKKASAARERWIAEVVQRFRIVRQGD